jgi:conflict system pore-forming effector with SLATT domain
MFSVTTLDLVRLDSDHVARNYTVHARAAERCASAAFGARIVIVSLLTAATASAIAALLMPGRGYTVAAAATSTLALVAFAVYAVLGLEARVAAHRQIAHRVWLVAERYRSLVAEINGGLVDGPTVLRRRDALIHDLHAIYEHGFAADQPGRELSRLPPWPPQVSALKAQVSG